MGCGSVGGCEVEVWEGGREVGVWSVGGWDVGVWSMGVWEGGSVGVWEGGWEDERSDEEERGTVAGSPGLRLQSV